MRRYEIVSCLIQVIDATLLEPKQYDLSVEAHLILKSLDETRLRIFEDELMQKAQQKLDETKSNLLMLREREIASK